MRIFASLLLITAGGAVTACGASTDILPVSTSKRGALCGAALHLAAEQDYRNEGDLYRAAAERAIDEGAQSKMQSVENESDEAKIAASIAYANEGTELLEELIAGSRSDLTRTIQACIREYGED